MLLRLMAPARQLEDEIEKVVDRMLEVSNPRALRAFEKGIEELERDKLIARERNKNAMRISCTDYFIESRYVPVLSDANECSGISGYVPKIRRNRRFLMVLPQRFELWTSPLPKEMIQTKIS